MLTAVDLLREAGYAIPDVAVEEGLDRARWKARFEILSREPLVIYDGAHNPQGIAGAVENIRSVLSPLAEDGKVGLLMGVMADKAHREMIASLAPLAAFAVTVRPDNARSLSAEEAAAEFVSCGTDAESFDVLADGVGAAVSKARKQGRPLVCLGSLYMYADVKQAVRDILPEYNA